MTDQPLRRTDPGLGPERTSLSWRRTALAMCGGTLVSFRIFPLLIGTIGFVLAGLALVVALVVLVAAEVRFRRERAVLLEGQQHPTAPTNRVPSSSGAFLAVTAAAVLVLGLLAAAVLIFER